MWLSNTASTAMMLPIANAILKSLFGEKDTSKDMNRENEENQGNWDRAVVQASWGLPCRRQMCPIFFISLAQVPGFLVATWSQC